MLNRDQEVKWKEELQQSLDALPVPSSLIQFAKEVPTKYEETRVVEIPQARRKKRKIAYKVAAAGVILVATSLGAMRVSPTFAEFVKQIPGFTLAESVIEQLFGRDGVDNAKSHGYQPFEPVIQQFNDVKVSISDVYLTSDRLIYRTIITSDNIKQHIFKREDGVSFLDRNADSYWISVVDFNDGANSAESSGGIYDDEKTKEPFLMDNHSIKLSPDEVTAFIDKHPKMLNFQIKINEKDRNSAESYRMQVPFDSTQLAKDKLIPLNYQIDVSGDPDLKALTVGQLTITPTDTYLDVTTGQGANYYLRFVGTENDSYIMDDKGKKYPLYIDDTQNIYEHGPDVVNGNKLTFMSSPYFDNDVKRLTLHLNEVHLTEKMPGGSFTFKLGEKLPKTVAYKGKQLTITGAYYDDVYLVLKIKKDPSDPARTGIRFAIPPQLMKPTKSDPELDRNGGIDGGEVRVINNETDHYTARIHAPKLDTYQIEMYRENSLVSLKKDIVVDLKR